MNRYFNIFLLILIGILFSFSGCDKRKDVTGVQIYPSVAVLKVGEDIRLEAIVFPEDADNKSVKWTYNTMESVDSLSDVISISENGKVQGLSEGIAKAICITNDLFYEASARIFVGYAVAVKGIYTGSLSENGTVINTTFKIGISHVSEYEALLGLPFISNTDACPVTVDYISEKMYFEGESTVDIQGVMTPVQVKGYVSLDGIGNFEILLGTAPTVTTYTFFGTIDNRSF